MSGLLQAGVLPHADSDRLPRRSTAALPADNPFVAPKPRQPESPFTAGATPAQPFKRAIEPVGLRPDMGPDPFLKEQGFNLFRDITGTQLVRGHAGWAGQGPTAPCIWAGADARMCAGRQAAGDRCCA